MGSPFLRLIRRNIFCILVLDRFVVQLGINLRCRHVLVTEQPLDNGYVHAGVQCVRRKGVAQQMRMDALIQPSALTGSTVALNALKNSGKCQNVTKDIRGAVTASFVSGLCFVFTAEITVSGGRCYIKAARPTGSNELTLCDAVKSATVNKFCKNPYVQCTDSSHTYEKNKLYFYKIG